MFHWRICAAVRRSDTPLCCWEATQRVSVLRQPSSASFPVRRVTSSSLPSPVSIFFLPLEVSLRASNGVPSRFCWLRIRWRLKLRTRLATLFSRRLRLGNGSSIRASRS
ncbi:hypothetical protein APX70_01214 [Pseudomonas syringae pv. maculicola]|uniref:Uncharacterized protein n=1 Tax=Pseudomonas syringae pv. maculicola TaxID=59511 RepID=A0A3M2YWN1_PSEYM|nr:hypothetical protein APX70_01214 [Pseudomonas syringae pv. maculicola]